MSYYPGFNPAAMNDDQLLEKYTELSKKLVWAERFSGSGEIVEQFQNMLAMIEMEKRDRTLLEVQKMRDKMFPAIIESDPSMVPAPVKEETKDQKKKTIIRDRSLMRKTKTPDRGS